MSGTWHRESQTETAWRIRKRSIERWGEARATVILGRHAKLAAALDRLARLAESDRTVLITGETGTGKELFAGALYLLSTRSRFPYLTVNCAQYQEGQLIASELFGHKRGSFTGAIADHRGVFEAANGGVVFLDEIGDLSAQTQALLLRALSEGEVLPVGEAHSRRVDVRVIAATNRNLRSLVEAGRFRADLYYRLCPLQIQVPPLRERGRDWELIFDHYLDQLSTARPGRKALSSEAVDILSAYHWPGNVRELRGLADAGFHLSEGDIIEPCDFAEALEAASHTAQITEDAVRRPRRMAQAEGDSWVIVDRRISGEEIPEPEAATDDLEDVQEAHILKVLGQERGNRTRAAEVLGISRATLKRRLAGWRARYGSDDWSGGPRRGAF